MRRVAPSEQPRIILEPTASARQAQEQAQASRREAARDAPHTRHMRQSDRSGPIRTTSAPSRPAEPQVSATPAASARARDVSARSEAPYPRIRSFRGQTAVAVSRKDGGPPLRQRHHDLDDHTQTSEGSDVASSLGGRGSTRPTDLSADRSGPIAGRCCTPDSGPGRRRQARPRDLRRGVSAGYGRQSERR